MEVLIIVGVIVLVPLVWWIATFNRFVRLKHAVKESWADIDVELKRRYDLIPNLVATVKGYASHESSVLQRVTESADWKKDLEQNYWDGEFIGGAGTRKLMDADHAQVKSLLVDLELAKQ